MPKDILERIFGEEEGVDEPSEEKVVLEGENIPENLKGKSPEEIAQRLKELEEKLAEATEALRRVGSEKPKEEKEEKEGGEGEKEGQQSDQFSVDDLISNPLVGGLVSLGKNAIVQEIVGDDEILREHQDEVLSIVNSIDPARLFDPTTVETIRTHLKGKYVNEYIEKKAATPSLDMSDEARSSAATGKPSGDRQVNLDDYQKAVLKAWYSGHEDTLRGMIKEGEENG